ncbi:UNVERIFIED_CONTAM: hypothetical protein GTU68_007372 [Idotea baltica]|nr:hypothetical protein [Idotea baltica]
MDVELKKRLTNDDVLKFSNTDHQHYFDFHGKYSLREAIAKFFNKYFNVAEDISPDNLIVMSGTASCLDSLSFALFDPDDIFITPTPTYARIFTDFNDRSLAQPYPLELPDDPEYDDMKFVLNSQILENRILELKGQGKSVKGFVLINPQNPLGDVYSPQLIRSLLEVCAKYEMHVIIDEIYALSLINTESDVGSVLSIPNLPDPQRTHFTWSLTKDFGLAGLRVGVIHTTNSALLKVLKDVAMYCPSASIIQDLATVLLSDTKWLDETYFPLYRHRLHERYHIVKNRLRNMGAIVRPSEGGLFLWLNLRAFLDSPTIESEMELFEELFESGVYVIPGTELFCKTPGWFRIVFSVSSKEIETGMVRLEAVLKKKGRNK